MSKKEVLGKVMWWSTRDENGVILDSWGNEYYIDRSTLKPRQMAKIKRGSVLYFRWSRVQDTLVAKSVRIPNMETVERSAQAISESQLSLAI